MRRKKKAIAYKTTQQQPTASPALPRLFSLSFDKTEFTSEAGEALRLTVRQDIKSKAGLKKLGLSILVFDFEPVGAITAESSPNASGRAAAPARDSSSAADAVTIVESAAQEMAGGARGQGEGAAAGAAEGEGWGTVGSAASAGGSRVVFVHDRVSQCGGEAAVIFGTPSTCHC